MLSVIIPVYDISPSIRGMTQRAITHLFMHTFGEWEATIVAQGPIGPIGRNLNVKMINLPERTSIAKAYNEGVKATQGKYICNLHNDAFVTLGWNELMMAEADKGNIVFPMVEQGNSAVRGIAPAPAWMPPSCCFVMTRDTWEKLGGYDERFEGLHWEDTDLFYRAVKMGINLVRVPVVVEHWRAMTRAALPDSGEAAMLANRKRFKAKHFGNEEFNGPWKYPTLCNYEATRRTQWQA